MNEKGIYHAMKGFNISDYVAKIDCLFLEARDRGIPTIGIADGGNEIGCGLIEEAVKQYRPNNAKCQCPCGTTIASHVPTDLLVFASISNWGAYGVEAALAAMLDDPNIIHDVDTMLWTLREAAASGLHNGPSGWLDPGTDSVPWRIECSIIKMLKRAVEEMCDPSFPKFY